MVQQLYSKEQLERFSISELRAECDAKGIARRRSKEDCIADILAAQPQPKKAFVTEADRMKAKALELGFSSFFKTSPGHYLVCVYPQSFAIQDIYDPYDLDSEAENPWVVEIVSQSLSQENQEISRHPSALVALEGLAAYLKSDESGDSGDERLFAQVAQVAQVEEQNDDYLFHDEQPKQPTNLPVVGDTHPIGGFMLRCATIGGDYAVVWDVHDENSLLMGEIRMGWDTFWSHPMSLGTFATPQEAVIDLHESLQVLVKEDEVVAFEKVAGRWEAVVNSVFVRITLEQDQYKSNLGDAVFADYESAVKGSLVAVAKLQTQSEVKSEFEIFATRLPNVFAVHSRKSGQRYEVYPDSGCCTCPHWLHRHEQDGFKDKHLEAVRAALQSGIPLLREPQTDTEKLIEKFTDEFGWIGGGQIVQAKVWLKSRFGDHFTEAILSGEARNKALQQEEQMDKEMANW